MRKYASCLCCAFFLIVTVQSRNAFAAEPDFSTVQKAAEQGDAAAQYSLGEIGVLQYSEVEFIEKYKLAVRSLGFSLTFIKTDKGEAAKISEYRINGLKNTTITVGTRNGQDKVYDTAIWADTQENAILAFTPLIVTLSDNAKEIDSIIADLQFEKRLEKSTTERGPIKYSFINPDNKIFIASASSVRAKNKKDANMTGDTFISLFNSLLKNFANSPGAEFVKSQKNVMLYRVTDLLMLALILEDETKAVKAILLNGGIDSNNAEIVYNTFVCAIYTASVGYDADEVSTGIKILGLKPFSLREGVTKKWEIGTKRYSLGVLEGILKLQIVF